MTKAQRGNLAASLRVHMLYAAPVLFSGLGSLVLSASEVNIVDSSYKNTVQNLQRLHQRTPRGVVFLLAGCLPGRAVLHCRQLSLFLMVCHLPGDPLHRHGQHVLTRATRSCKSWFNQVLDLCSLYELPHPQELLDNPPEKLKFKELVKNNVTQYWHEIFTKEISGLKSLKYFKPELYSLTKPHYMWSLAASSPYETAKCTVLAIMASGRYRTDMLTRYWGKNKSGCCRSPSCSTTPGTLEHLLVACPALSQTRERLYRMWLERTIMFPTLHATIRAVLESPDHIIVQFVLEPLAFPDILTDFVSHGVHFAHLLAYLTRTFAFCMHRDYQRLIKQQDNPTHQQVMSMFDTNISSFSVPMCEVTTHQPALHTTGHQDCSADPGQTNVVGRSTSTAQVYSQPMRQCGPV